MRESSDGRRQAKLARSAGASPAQVRPSKPPGSKCCVSRRRRRTRSVHSGCVGCVIEPRNDEFAGAETVVIVERNMCNAVMRGIAVPPGSKSTSRAKGLRRNLGYPTSGRRLRVRSRVRRSASGRRGAVADDARAWEVGRGHSSCEAGEQGRAICCGVGGARGRDRGECASTLHAPDSEPGKRGTGRWLVYGTELPSIPEVGAGCGNPARTDRGGGREVPRVPTAKANLWARPAAYRAAGTPLRPPHRW